MTEPSIGLQRSAREPQGGKTISLATATKERCCYFGGRDVAGKRSPRMIAAIWKDYSLRDDDANTATSLTREDFEDKVEQSWHSSPVDRKKFRELIKRSDAPAIRFFGLWLALLVASGLVAYLSWR